MGINKQTHGQFLYPFLYSAAMFTNPVTMNAIIGRSASKRIQILLDHSTPIWVTSGQIDNNLHLNMEHILRN